MIFFKKNGRKFLKVDSLEKIFDGVMTLNQYQHFENEVGFNSAIIHPVLNNEGSFTIGYVVYFYMNNHQPKYDEFNLTTFLMPSAASFSRKCRVSRAGWPSLPPSNLRISGPFEPCPKGSPRRVQEHTHVHSRPCPYRGFVDAIEPGDALLVLALALLEDIVTESTLVVVVDPALLPIDGRFVQRD